MTSHDNWIDSQINNHVNSLDGSDYSKENIYLEDDALNAFFVANGGYDLVAQAIEQTYNTNDQAIEYYLNDEYQECSELPEHFDDFELIETDQKNYFENLLADISDLLAELKIRDGGVMQTSELKIADILEHYEGQVIAFIPVIHPSANLGIAVANESGYSPIPKNIYSESNYNEAQNEADRLNEEYLKLSIGAAREIISSTMPSRR